MSRILRRPLFRGGPVSSYGTGIASGLADGGRVGYNQAGLVTWQDVLKSSGQDMMKGSDLLKLNPNLKLNPKTLYSSKDSVGMDFGQSPSEMADSFSEGSTYMKWLEEKGKPEEFETETIASGETKFKVDEDGNRIPIKKDDLSLKDFAEKTRIEKITESDPQGDLEAMGITATVAEDGTGTGTNILEERRKEKLLPGVTTEPKGNVNTSGALTSTEESTAISADDVREQAALFDKLLNEDYEKDLKSARIGDASDYALQFFKSTVGEGKGIKEAAGDVAGRALAAPSRTERVQEGKKKTKQTATVMAINEAISQGKSDREIKKLLAVADYKGNINLENAIALANHKDKKTNFFDNYKENRKSMGSGEAAIFTVQETFGKSPTILKPEQIEKGVVVTNKENIGEYFIYPDGKITLVKPEGNKIVEEIVLSRGG
jgi:hypothetical protein